MFCHRPLTKPEWVDTLKTNHFVAQRKGETLWVFDPDLDREPAPHDGHGTSNVPNDIDPVHFENFGTAFDEMVDVTNNNIVDLLFVPDGKHRTNFTNVHKHIKKCKE